MLGRRLAGLGSSMASSTASPVALFAQLPAMRSRRVGGSQKLIPGSDHKDEWMIKDGHVVHTFMLFS